MALADPTQIHQVLVNLGSNAAHAMREKGGVLEVGLAEIRLDRGGRCPVHRPQAGGIPPPDGEGYRPWHGARGRGPDLRAVLHDQEDGRGDGDGAGRRPRHRQEPRRHDLGPERARERHRPSRSSSPGRSEPRRPERKSPGSRTRREPSAILFVDDEDIQVRAMSRLLEHLGYRVVGLTDSRGGPRDHSAGTPERSTWPSWTRPCRTCPGPSWPGRL